MNTPFGPASAWHVAYLVYKTKKYKRTRHLHIVTGKKQTN